MTEQHADTWTPTQHAHNGSVDIAYDHLASSSGEPLLLVMGLGTSRFWWPLGLCQHFAAQGFEVARYDQRDAGQSTRMPDTSTSNPFAALFAKKGDAYSSEDMTDDAIGRVAAGRDTAKRVPAARFVLLPGVGHDLPEALWPTVAAEVRHNADRVATWQAH